MTIEKKRFIIEKVDVITHKGIYGDWKENRFRRINVRKIVSLKEIAKQGYSDVYIEINEPNNLKKLYEVIKEKGNSKIKIAINDKNKRAWAHAIRKKVGQSMFNGYIGSWMKPIEMLQDFKKS